jgi:hypothetical protein
MYCFIVKHGGTYKSSCFRELIAVSNVQRAVLLLATILKSSKLVEPRRHICKQLMKCLSIRKVTYQLFKLTDIQAVTTH